MWVAMTQVGGGNELCNSTENWSGHESLHKGTVILSSAKHALWSISNIS